VWCGVDWIRLAQDGDRWRSLVNITTVKARSVGEVSFRLFNEGL
jgi:hypothetical protein